MLPGQVGPHQVDRRGRQLQPEAEGPSTTSLVLPCSAPGTIRAVLTQRVVVPGHRDRDSGRRQRGVHHDPVLVRLACTGLSAVHPCGSKRARIVLAVRGTEIAYGATQARA